MALHVMLCVKSTWRKLPVGGNVANGLLKISPDFLSKTKNKKKQIKKPSLNLQIPTN